LINLDLGSRGHFWAGYLPEKSATAKFVEPASFLLCSQVVIC